MIGIVCGFVVASVILLLTFALISAHWMLERANELYKIACDEAKYWHEKYDALDAVRSQAREIPLSSILAKSNYHAERDRERKSIGGMNEFERKAGCG